MKRDFEAYGEPLENLTAFRYLGRVLTAGYDKWLAVLGNLSKSVNSLEAVILYIEPVGGGSESVGTLLQSGGAGGVALQGRGVGTHPRMERALDRFHNRVAQRLTKRQSRRQGGGSWAYPPLEETMGEARFEGIRKSVTRRQSTVA